MKGEDVVGAFFEDGWFGGYGACGGLRRREEMDVGVVAVAVGGWGREGGCC